MGSKTVAILLQAFKLGYDIMPSKSEKEYEAAKTRYTNAMADYYESGKGGESSTRRTAAYERNVESQITAREAETARKAKLPVTGGMTAGQEDKLVGAEDPDLQALPPPQDDTSFEQDAVDADLTESPPPDDTLEFSRGGAVPTPKRVVRRYANGGGVVEDEELAVPLRGTGSIPMAEGTQQLAPPPNALAVAPAAGMERPQTQAIPARVPAPQPTQPTEGAAGDVGPGFSYTAAMDAAEAGMQARDEKPADKPEAVPTPETSKKAAPGASLDQVNALWEKVDPEHKLSLDQRNMKALAWAWESYLQLSKPDKAQTVAKDLVETYEGVSNRYNHITQKCLQDGDLDGACAALLKRYAYVPDGLDVQLQKAPDGRYAYKYSDSVSGKTIEKGLKTPQEMLQIVTHASMLSFDDLVEAGSGKRYDQMQGGKVEKAIGTEPTGMDPSAVGATETIKRGREAGADRDAAAAEKKVRDAATDKRNAEKDKAITDKNKADATTAYRKEAAATASDGTYSRAAVAAALEEGGDAAKEFMPTTQEAFDLLPVGAYFINPKDKRILRKPAPRQ